MSFEVHINTDRGHVDHGWLKTIHSFRIACFVNEKRMNIGTLVVLNEDRIAPGMGFGEHFHDNEEIVTIPSQERKHPVPQGNQNDSNPKSAGYPCPYQRPTWGKNEKNHTPPALVNLVPG